MQPYTLFKILSGFSLIGMLWAPAMIVPTVTFSILAKILQAGIKQSPTSGSR